MLQSLVCDSSFQKMLAPMALPAKWLQPAPILASIRSCIWSDVTYGTLASVSSVYMCRLTGWCSWFKAKHDHKYWKPQKLFVFASTCMLNIKVQSKCLLNDSVLPPSKLVIENIFKYIFYKEGISNNIKFARISLTW